LEKILDKSLAGHSLVGKTAINMLERNLLPFQFGQQYSVVHAIAHYMDIWGENQPPRTLITKGE